MNSQHHTDSIHNTSNTYLNDIEYMLKVSRVQPAVYTLLFGWGSAKKNLDFEPFIQNHHNIYLNSIV